MKQRDCLPLVLVKKDTWCQWTRSAQGIIYIGVRGSQVPSIKLRYSKYFVTLRLCFSSFQHGGSFVAELIALLLAIIPSQLLLRFLSGFDPGAEIAFATWYLILGYGISPINCSNVRLEESSRLLHARLVTASKFDETARRVDGSLFGHSSRTGPCGSEKWAHGNDYPYFRKRV